MTTIIRKAPIGKQSDYRPYAWAALALPFDRTPNSSAKFFKVLIDTGSNQHLSIREDKILSFFDPRMHDTVRKELRRNRKMHSSNRGTFFYAQFALFLFGESVTGEQSQPDRSRFARLIFTLGIEVFPQPDRDEPDNRPFSPVLGMRAIWDNLIQFSTDGRTFSLGAPGKLRRLLGW